MEDLDKILKTDPISEFEKIYGKDYKTNTEEDNKNMLGVAIHHNMMKEASLSTAGDTTFCMSGDDYQRNIEDFGFELIYQEDFEGDSLGDIYKDTLKVFWLDGLLLHFDTYNGSRNSGAVHYNWVPNPDLENRYGLTSSGRYASLNMLPDLSGELLFPETEPELAMDKESWEEFKHKKVAYQSRLNDFREENNLRAIWVGNHDCREAIRHNITNLKNNGDILNTWIYPETCCWITHWGEKDEIYGNLGRNKDPDTRTLERMAKFPQHVKDAIKVQIEYMEEKITTLG